MITSFGGIAFIASFEGFKSKAYLDVGGLYTIGYGHLIKGSEWYLKYSEITEDQGREILSKDLREAERCVNLLVISPITQYQFDALVSFTFNLGCGTLKSSMLLNLINRGVGHPEDEFLLFNKAKVKGVYKTIRGLLKRRVMEREVFLGREVRID